MDMTGWFGEQRRAEIGSRGGMRALLLPKPVIGRGADWEQTGLSRAASDSARQLPTGNFPRLRWSAFCLNHIHTGAPRTASKSRFMQLSSIEQRERFTVEAHHRTRDFHFGGRAWATTQRLQ
jgi:hypothetical protein